MNAVGNETILLYALSTFAQTCAALAAFVGALGVYRLQSLMGRRQEAERNLRALLVSTRVVTVALPELPLHTILEGAKEVVELPQPQEKPKVPRIREALSQLETFEPDHRRCMCMLFWFEAWNLAVIFVALVGFNHLGFLSRWPGTSWGLWGGAVGTVVVTGLMLLEISGFFAGTPKAGST